MLLDRPPYFATWGDSDEPDVSGQIGELRAELYELRDPLMRGKPAPYEGYTCPTCGGEGDCPDCEGLGIAYRQVGEPTPGLIAQMQTRIDALEKQLAEVKATADMLNAVVGRMLPA